MQTDDIPLPSAAPDMSGNPHWFKMTFEPAQQAITLLARIAAGEAVPPEMAGQVLTDWKASLATELQHTRAQSIIRGARLYDSVEIDSDGACVSEVDDGLWIQAWFWVEKEGS